MQAVLSKICISFFNVVAELLCQMKLMSPEYFSKEKSPDSLQLSDYARNDIDTYLNKLYQISDSHNIKASTLLATFGLPVEMYKEIKENWKYREDFSALYHLVDELSAVLTDKDLHACTENLKPGFECLNNNVETTGILILPYFHGINERYFGDSTDRYSDESDNKDEENKEYKWVYERSHLCFNNLYYIEDEKLRTDSKRKFVIRNYITPRINGKKTITDKLIIAASPIVKSDLLDYSCCSTSMDEDDSLSKRTFFIKGLKNPELVHKKIIAAYDYASAVNADILVFPEMLGDDITTGKNFWRELGIVAESKGYTIPKLVITPSWWHDYTNETYVYDEGSNLLFSQQKHFPYDFSISKKNPKESFEEDLRNNNNVINILHMPGVGRIMFAICKDFLIESYRKILLHELRASLLLTPSFSKGSTQFQLSMLDPEQYGCYQVWLNTCAAFINNAPDFIGQSAMPFLRENQNSWYPKLELKCDGNCGDESDYCFFLITIGLDENLERTLSCEHYYPGSNSHNSNKKEVGQ